MGVAAVVRPPGVNDQPRKIWSTYFGIFGCVMLRELTCDVQRNVMLSVMP